VGEPYVDILVNSGLNRTLAIQAEMIHILSAFIRVLSALVSVTGFLLRLAKPKKDRGGPMTREECAERVLGLLDNRKSQPFPRSVKRANREPDLPRRRRSRQIPRRKHFLEGDNPRPFASFPGSPRMRLGFDQFGNRETNCANLFPRGS